MRDSFNEISIAERLKFEFNGISSPYWIAGFVSGDGSFNIKTTNLRTKRVQLSFAVNLHIREKEVIKGLAQFFNIKQNSYIYYTASSVAIQIVNTSDILNIIVPFLDKYPLEERKRLDFIDFKTAADIVKGHLTEKGYKEILQIKNNMNLNRK